MSLFTRPRRFGKTLTLSMLKCFLKIQAVRRETVKIKSCLRAFNLFLRQHLYRTDGEISGYQYFFKISKTA
ncbi:MAG: AAA family ATPase [Blautia marasmi]